MMYIVNELIVTLEDLYEIFNYADNIVTCHCITLPEYKEKEETVINKMFLDWFKVNQMKVNDDKFLCIKYCKNKNISYEYVNVGSSEITSSSCVKLPEVILMRN